MSEHIFVFWDVTRLILVVSYWRLETTFRSHLSSFKQYKKNLLPV